MIDFTKPNTTTEPVEVPMHQQNAVLRFVILVLVLINIVLIMLLITGRVEIGVSSAAAVLGSASYWIWKGNR
jgi:hypothetical protein